MAGGVISGMLVVYCLGFLLLFAATPSHQQSSTLRQGVETESLSSNDGRFELRFDRPRNSDGSYRVFGDFDLNNVYLGVWRSSTPILESVLPVWIANRNRPYFVNRADPISGSGLTVTIDKLDGSFKILQHGEPVITIAAGHPDYNGNYNSTVTLEDSGNLVFHKLHPDGSKQKLWQSFDHPFDTFLPGMKIGIDHRNGHNWNLTSARSEVSYDVGSFTFGIDPSNTTQLVIWQRGRPIWKSDANKFSPNRYRSFSLVSNENETCLYYNVTTAGGKLIEYSRIDPNGWLSYGRTFEVVCDWPLRPYSKWEPLQRPECRNSDFERDPEINKWWIVVIIIVALLAIVPPSVGFCYMLHINSKHRGMKINWRNLFGLTEETILPKKSSDISERQAEDENEVQTFGFETIVVATNYFSAANKLGEGGFGSVYKGRLMSGQEIAIKRLSGSSGQGFVEFRNEVVLIAKLQHTNLVRLLGLCILETEMILVYEYMPNKSLDFILFDPERKSVLNWTKRFHIIDGIAQGLLYLHKYSRLRVIHRDLKASNVLLDGEMNPKISDFGMARIFSITELEVNTRRVVGTYGYMSPEYALHGVVSVKLDVFSFGVLLLEIVSGKKNNNFYLPDQQPVTLIGYAWQLWNEGRGLEIVDQTLGDINTTNAMRCIHIGLLCVQDQAADRPTMSEVVGMLSNETLELVKPKQPAFFIGGGVEDMDGVQIDEESFSKNTITISTMEAR